MDTTQLLKGVLDAAVLAVVDADDGYGYDIVRRLRESGLNEVGDASVYGTLRRLYATGALTSYVLPSDTGPHRKYYGITPLGKTMLHNQRDTWRSFSASMCTLLRTPENASTTPGNRPSTSRNVPATAQNPPANSENLVRHPADRPSKGSK